MTHDMSVHVEPDDRDFDEWCRTQIARLAQSLRAPALVSCEEARYALQRDGHLITRGTRTHYSGAKRREQE